MVQEKAAMGWLVEIQSTSKQKFQLTFPSMVWTSGEILSKWQISNVKRQRLGLFAVWETWRRLVVERHSQILCSHCATSLLTSTPSALNSIFIRAPQWFAAMSQSISFCRPSGSFHRLARGNQTLSSQCKSHHAERLPRFENHICYWQILDVGFTLKENQMAHEKHHKINLDHLSGLFSLKLF